MKISSNKVVSLTYELKIEDQGEMLLVESVSQEQPFVYLHGLGGLPQLFESNLDNLSVGDSFSFILKAEDSGYGDIDESAVVDLPKNVFIIDDKFDDEMIRVGAFVPMSDTEGNKMQGLVLEINEDFVKMDFNHPLAGKDLHFNGSIFAIREASTEELDHGHVHGEGGHHH